MTDVRQTARAHRATTDRREQRARERDSKDQSKNAPAGVPRVAQVRLRSEEMDALQAVMRTLHLGSTSDALREGLRLLAREAAEVDAAADIRAFYAGEPVPLPDGVIPPAESELTAADSVRW